ncbi:MAG: 5-(carboxyamino)imidazole ribonucleotide mutase [Gammaproteobacteria bacterium]|nr:5-(carboxyamino)imidazole ribonucleotide mutase [Gammaproteobacteria bacterium]
MKKSKQDPLVGVVMGSRSDWPCLQHASEKLEALSIPHEVSIVSAHRTPDRLFDYATNASARGLKIIIAGAGGAAHLPGMLAAKTIIPVLGVPIEATSLQGLDALLSIVQMPGGVPVATFAVGKAGAINAALFAAQILALTDATIEKALAQYRAQQTAQVLAHLDPREPMV